MLHFVPSFVAKLQRPVPFAAALLCLLIVARGAIGEPAFRQDFNGPETTWTLLKKDSSAKIQSQQRLAIGARNAAGAEQIVAVAPAGDSIFLHCPIVRVAVLPELRIDLWVKSNRPSVQLAAQVVLPRTLDQESGEMAKVLVRGTATTHLGQWQQLTIAEIPKLLAAQVRVMRAIPGATIDPKEAYVEAVVLVVPGDPQGVEVATDDLEVDGVLLTHANDVQLASFPVPTSSATAGTPATDSVRLQGGLLLVGNRPYLPRVIEWQGEPLAFLAERGFNTVFLREAPSDEQIAEARQHGLWFVCVAPQPDAITRDGIGRNGDRVIAWHFDDEAIEADPNYARRWAALVRQHDKIGGRPVVVAPEVDWHTASKSADILAAQHPFPSRLSAQQYDRWLQGRPRLARPGTPIWAAFATQISGAAHQQAIALSETMRVPPAVDLAQLDALVQRACTRGARGFIFRSDSSLAEPEAATRERAAALEMINHRLQLIEPWLAGGKQIGQIVSADGAWTGVVLHVDRARLLFPLPVANTNEDAAPQPATLPTSTEITFLVPGVPASSQAYALSPAALRMLPTQRAAGGTRLVLPATPDTYAVITEDIQVIQSLRQTFNGHGPQMVRLERDRAIQRAALVTTTAQRLAQLGYANEPAAGSAASLRDVMQRLEAQPPAGRLEQTWELASTANRAINQAMAGQRQAVVATSNLDSHPLAQSYDQLADYAAFQRTYQQLGGGDNLLYGGDFEDLGQMTHFGWRHFQHPQPGISSRVELSTAEPKHGGYCLALHSAATAENQQQTVVEGPCASVVSPPMPVDEGQVIEITGWVRIVEPFGDEGEALQIVDSLGGPDLSLAVRQTNGWQPFRMLRAAPQTTEFRLTFALAGVGTARVDAVMVRELAQPAARRLPPVPSDDDANVADQPTRLPSVPARR